MDTFAERLRQAMRESHLRPVDIYNRTGIERSAISNYLAGRYSPKPETMTKLAEALKVDPGWLAGYNDENSRISFSATFTQDEIMEYAAQHLIPNLTVEEKKILVAYRKADPKIQQAIRLMLQVSE